MEKIKITTYCGLDCDNCELKKKCNCGGCVSTEGKPFHGECEVAKCCISRGRQFCGDCWEYPCKKLKSFSYDSEHGDNGERLKNCDRIKANLVACAREGLEPIAYFLVIIAFWVNGVVHVVLIIICVLLQVYFQMVFAQM